RRALRGRGAGQRRRRLRRLIGRLGAGERRGGGRGSGGLGARLAVIRRERWLRRLVGLVRREGRSPGPGRGPVTGGRRTVVRPGQAGLGRAVADRAERRRLLRAAEILRAAEVLR